jgi:hypothetical protein
MNKTLKIVAAMTVSIVVITAGAVWWGYAHLTGLVQSRLRTVMGDDLSIGSVVAHWNRIELSKIVLIRRGNGTFDKRLAIDRLELNPRLKSLLSGRLELGVIRIENPYVLMEIAPDGSLIKPVPEGKKASGETAGGAALPVTIDGITISGGKLDVLDWSVGRRNVVGLSNPKERYHHTSFKEILFEIGKQEIPLADVVVPLKLSLNSSGGGTLEIHGKLSPKTLECSLNLAIRDLNIVHYRPYFQKSGDLTIKSGYVSIGSDISVSKRQLKAPGTILLKQLTFDQSGARGIMMGIPAFALVNFMADNKGELKVDFSLNGSLDNPRFTVRESFVNQVASSISGKLGIATAGSVGSGIIGGAGTGVIKGLIKAFGDR